MNENKRIDNPRIAKKKQTMGLIFNIQNSQLLNWSLPTEEIIQVPGQNRPEANLPAAAARNAITKATKYVIFGFSFRILVSSSRSRKV